MSDKHDKDMDRRDKPVPYFDGVIEAACRNAIFAGFIDGPVDAPNGFVVRVFVCCYVLLQ